MPLSLATIAGSGVAVVVIAALALTGAADRSAPLLVLLALLFLGGVQLISLGIIGPHLARLHEESPRRPRYLLSRVVRSQEEAAEPTKGGQPRL